MSRINDLGVNRRGFLAALAGLSAAAVSVGSASANALAAVLGSWRRDDVSRVVCSPVGPSCSPVVGDPSRSGTRVRPVSPQIGRHGSGHGGVPVLRVPPPPANFREWEARYLRFYRSYLADRPSDLRRAEARFQRIDPQRRRDIDRALRANHRRRLLRVET